MKSDLEYPDFINEEMLHSLCNAAAEPDPSKVNDILEQSLELEPLAEEQAALLLAVRDKEQAVRIEETARELKRRVYGNRIVIFAPLYIGNHCINDCSYCAFRKSLRSTVRKTLNGKELREQVVALEDSGHKRLILVFGEHPLYSPKFIAETVRSVYETRSGPGEIRRVNINAAPLDHEGYRTVKAAGIGTYQVFQETYHRETYARVHPAETHKGDYMYRLHALTRAYEAGCDDVGIGALYGLYDWKFETLALISHARFLHARFGCGPHTISFPRIRPAHGMDLDEFSAVDDYAFRRLVAVLRLAVPYTGMILTAREPARIRREIMEFGVSQIDAGTRIELAGYTDGDKPQNLKREQFEIGDLRSLDEIMLDLLEHDYIPSFCTSCYRRGRTGEQFMEFAVPGFIEKFCTPNAMLTLAEYLEDYASPETQAAGYKVIAKSLDDLEDPQQRQSLTDQLGKIRNEDVRDVYL